MRAAFSTVCSLIDVTDSSYIYIRIDKCQIHNSQYRNLFCIAPRFARLFVNFVVRKHVVCQSVYNRRTQFVQIQPVPADTMHESFHTFIAHIRNKILLYT